MIAADIAPTLNAHFGEKQGLEDQHINGGGGCSLPSISLCLNAGAMGRLDAESETLIPVSGGAFDVAHALRADGFDASEDGTGRGTPIVPVAFDTTQITSAGNFSNPRPGDPCHPLAAGAHPPAVAFDLRGREGGAQFEGPHDTANIRAASGGSSRSYVAQQAYSIMPQNSGKDYKARPVDVAQPIMAAGPTGGNQGGDYIATNWAVRRLTPEECEKLQGVPVGYTKIPWRGKAAELCPDGPRYKALGNSWAVPVVRWIGERLLENMP